MARYVLGEAYGETVSLCMIVPMSRAALCLMCSPTSYGETSGVSLWGGCKPVLGVKVQGRAMPMSCPRCMCDPMSYGETVSALCPVLCQINVLIPRCEPLGETVSLCVSALCPRYVSRVCQINVLIPRC